MIPKLNNKRYYWPVHVCCASRNCLSSRATHVTHEPTRTWTHADLVLGNHPVEYLADVKHWNDLNVSFSDVIVAGDGWQNNIYMMLLLGGKNREWLFKLSFIILLSDPHIPHAGFFVLSVVAGRLGTLSQAGCHLTLIAFVLVCVKSHDFASTVGQRKTLYKSPTIYQNRWPPFRKSVLRRSVERVVF